MSTTTDSTLNLTVPKDYAWVLAGLVTLAAQLFFVSLIYVTKVRSEVFKKVDLRKAFGEEHKKATGQKINIMGYPDNGSGRYADQLPYGDWYRFNIAQRIHYNFLEFFAPFSVITLVAGLHKPCITAIVCFAMVLARVFFHLGYTLGNANNPFRILGALGSDVGFIINFLVAVAGVLTWLGYI